MKVRYQYLKITMKRSLCSLPAQLLVAVILIGLASGLLLLSNRFFYQDSLYKRQQVGVVWGEQQQMTDLVMNFVQEMDSVDAACELIVMDRQQAFRALEQGDVIAVMVVPASVLEDILDGTNTPVQIYLPKEATFESMVFGELLEAAASLLTTAQAQIYAVYDLALSADAMEFLHGYEQEIDAWNLRLVLNRDRSFRMEQVDVFGKVSITAYYLAAGGILLFLLWGMGAVFLREEHFDQSARMLRRAGVGSISALLIKWVVETIWILGIEILYGALIRLFTGVLGINLTISRELVVVLLCGAAFIAAIHLFFYQLFTQQTSVMLALSIGSVGMLFLAGGFVPATFLPASVTRIGKLLPINRLLQMQSEILQYGVIQDSEFHKLLLGTLLWAIAFLAGSVLIHWNKIRR